jgi:hypothetical protein
LHRLRYIESRSDRDMSEYRTRTGLTANGRFKQSYPGVVAVAVMVAAAVHFVLFDLFAGASLP